MRLAVFLFRASGASGTSAAATRFLLLEELQEVTPCADSAEQHDDINDNSLYEHSQLSYCDKVD